MHITKCLVFLAFGLIPTLIASPFQAIEPKDIDVIQPKALEPKAIRLECIPFQIIITIITFNHGQAFCSSFLGIQTHTVTAYSTVTTTSTTNVPGPTITSTTLLQPVTTTNVVTQPTTETTTVTTEEVSTTSIATTFTITWEETSTVYTSLPTPSDAVGKRSPDAIAPRDPPIPPFLGGYVSSAISKACSCLDLPTPTTTITLPVTTTAVATSTGTPVTVVVSQGTTTTVSKTSFTTTTATALTTTTLLETEFYTTYTDVTTTTTTSRLINCSPGPEAPYNTQGAPNVDGGYGNFDFEDPVPDVQTCCELCYYIGSCIIATYNAEVEKCSIGYPVSGTVLNPVPPGLELVCPFGISSGSIFGPGPYFAGPCSGPAT